VKLACVVHRFGEDLAGGSEGHCRLVAQHLAEGHDVTVLTTTAHDHVSWANHYAAGESRAGRVRVLRFPVDRTRDLHRFQDISDVVFSGNGTEADLGTWFHENGPRSAGLLQHLTDHGRDYDVVLFWAYRYYVTYFGLPLVRERSVLVPTAEDDALIHAEGLRHYFAAPRGFLFLTPEEASLVGALVPPATPREIIGCGIDPPAAVDRRQLSALGLPDEYLLYLGRVDPNKGCRTLLRYYERYVSSRAPVQLVLAGPANMPVPAHPSIRHLGYVTDAIRDALLAHARVLIIPSPYESLSMVLLEAWNYRVPALVNARCDVLKGQVTRADGGLYYRNGMEFETALEYLRSNRAGAAELGSQGRAYVDREYRWPCVMDKIERLIAHLRQERTSAP
jgi:glycosyltransferase involved in cell wall biosynthesis